MNYSHDWKNRTVVCGLWVGENPLNKEGEDGSKLGKQHRLWTSRKQRNGHRNHQAPQSSERLNQKQKQKLGIIETPKKSVWLE